MILSLALKHVVWCCTLLSKSLFGWYLFFVFWFIDWLYYTRISFISLFGNNSSDFWLIWRVSGVYFTFWVWVGGSLRICKILIVIDKMIGVNLSSSGGVICWMELVDRSLSIIWRKMKKGVHIIWTCETRWAILNLQTQHDELEAKFFEERAALEAKYQKLYQPLYSKVCFTYCTGICLISWNMKSSSVRCSLFPFHST